MSLEKDINTLRNTPTKPIMQQPLNPAALPLGVELAERIAKNNYFVGQFLTYCRVCGDFKDKHRDTCIVVEAERLLEVARRGGG